MSKIWKNNDIIGSADAQRWEDKADSQDLQDLQNKIEIDGVDTAKRLKTPRTIALSGHASGSVTFDGSTNVNLPVSIQKLAELSNEDTKLLNSIKDLDSKKADKTVAQMFKLTQDNGELVVLSGGDVNAVTEPKKYFCRKVANTPAYYGMLTVEKSVTGSSEDVFQFFTTVNDVKKEVILYWRWKNQRMVWSDTNWERLPKLSDLELKADKSKAQMFKLTKDNGIAKTDSNNANVLVKSGNYFLDNPANAWDKVGGDLHLTVNAKDDLNCVQIGTDSANVTCTRTQVNGRWSKWVKLGGLDVKTYDIVFSGGVRAAAGTKETENKVIVYGDVAHLTLNIDMSKAGKTPSITLPREVAVNLRGNVYSNSKTEYALVSNVGRSGTYATNQYYGAGELGRSDKETTRMPALTFVASDKNWSNATKMRIKFTSNERGTKYKGYYSWYVGG